MIKTIQKNITVIAGLFLISQSALIPAASAAGILADSQPSYLNAATSADPVIYAASASADKVVDNDGFNFTIANVIERFQGAVSVDKTDQVTDNSTPTIDEVKAYVLGEVKKAGLNVAQAEALVKCESHWDYLAVNKMNSNGSNDKGLWQINSIHKDISDADKLDYKASTKWAIAKRLADGNWSAWSCAAKRAPKVAVIEPTW